MLISALDAHVEPDREAALRAAYRETADSPFPPGLIRSFLLRTATDPTLWRIETHWESREAIEAMRGKGTPRGVLIFQAASATPALTVYEVVDTLTP